MLMTLMSTCKPCLEKSSKGSNKIYKLFAKILCNSYFRKYLKTRCRWFQGRNLSWGSTSTNLDAHKWFYRRRVWRGRSCNAKENKVNHYENSVAGIFPIFWVSFVLMVFRWKGGSSCGCYVLERLLDVR